MSSAFKTANRINAEQKIRRNFDKGSYVNFLKVILSSALLAACNVTESFENNLPSSVVVGPELIQRTLDAASDRYTENKTLYEASVAQVVMNRCPKIELFRPFWKPRLDLKI